MENFILPPFITAFIATALAVPFCLIFIKKLKLFDDPKTHKHPGVIHKKPIPRGGGIPLFIGIFIACLFFVPVIPSTIAILTASFIALVIGVLDDKYDISPYIRFGFNILCAVIVVKSGISIAYITNPF